MFRQHIKQSRARKEVTGGQSQECDQEMENRRQLARGRGQMEGIPDNYQGKGEQTYGNKRAF